MWFRSVNFWFGNTFIYKKTQGIPVCPWFRGLCCMRSGECWHGYSCFSPLPRGCGIPTAVVTHRLCRHLPECAGSKIRQDFLPGHRLHCFSMDVKISYENWSNFSLNLQTHIGWKSCNFFRSVLQWINLSVLSTALPNAPQLFDTGEIFNLSFTNNAWFPRKFQSMIGPLRGSAEGALTHVDVRVPIILPYSWP